MTWKLTSSRPFLIFKESLKKSSEEVCMLKLIDFDSFAIAYLI